MQATYSHGLQPTTAMAFNLILHSVFWEGPSTKGVKVSTVGHPFARTREGHRILKVAPDGKRTFFNGTSRAQLKQSLPALEPVQLVGEPNSNNLTPCLSQSQLRNSDPVTWGPEGLEFSNYLQTCHCYTW